MGLLPDMGFKKQDCPLNLPAEVVETQVTGHLAVLHLHKEP